MHEKVVARPEREPVIDVRDPFEVRETTEVTERILDAALALVARWGVTKTSLADIAKAAVCSRATVYRAFPGGKTHLFESLGLRELSAYCDAIVEVIDLADDLDDALTRGLVVAARLLHDHDAAQFILEHEPELLLPFLGFTQVEVVYRLTALAVGPHLERFLPPDRAAWAAEWCARLFITFVFNPGETDLGRVDDARHLVSSFLSPAFATIPAS
ncbi:MAG: transcriptional regulator, TetR family [Ilumatobacteraceae bacterium]|nr:transcriptional regulator, TetR family [Ilumatobacteraceae bacterium]